MTWNRLSDSADTVSIGLPVYNGERYLEQAIGAVLSQTYSPLELVVVDNASTDKTSQIVGDFMRSDPRVRYFRNPFNIGAAANYNRAFKLSQGSVFKWTTHDDIIKPSFVEECLRAMLISPGVVLSYPRTELISEDGDIIRSYDDRCTLMESEPQLRLDRFLRNVRLCHPVLGLIRRDVLERTRLIRPYVGSDFALLAELALYGRFAEVPDALFLRRDHSGNIRKASLKQQARWFSPSAGTWRHRVPDTSKFLMIIQAIWRTPVSAQQKLGCSLTTALWLARCARSSIGCTRRRLLETLKRSAGSMLIGTSKAN